MLHYIWNTLLYKPLFNALALLVAFIPGGDIGIAIILLTLIVKLILFPLSQRAIENQAAMAILTPEINKIKASGASKEEQAKLTFELYRKHKTNPFSGCLVQIPAIIVIFALYHLFYKGLDFSPDMLYSFVQAPENVNMLFLGFLDISQKGILSLAILAGVSQYFQAYFMPQPPASPGAAGSFGDSFAKSMSFQMKYFFPFLIAFMSYTLFSGAVALYWITSNIFTIGQQLYVKKTERKTLALEAKELVIK